MGVLSPQHPSAGSTHSLGSSGEWMAAVGGYVSGAHNDWGVLLALSGGAKHSVQDSPSPCPKQNYLVPNARSTVSEKPALRVSPQQLRSSDCSQFCPKG